MGVVLKFEQYYLDCLSQASYLIGDTETGRAVVVDPRRDVDIYCTEAEEVGLSIELIIETHFHADFLSGHLELRDRTGADIGFGQKARTEFPSRGLADGERIELGDVVLEVRATPGHTPESISVVVYEHSADEVPYGVLTGDTLFIGDVGRPDLLAAAGADPADMAHDLYRSIHEKLLVLPDRTRVFPAHGAGSACGKNLSTETQSTIGEQRASNYALAIDDPDEFARTVTAGQPTAPGYFSYDAARNREDHALLDTDGPKALSLEEVLGAVSDGAVAVDTRAIEDAARGTLEGAINIGLDGRFAEYGGLLLDPDADIVIIAEPGLEDEARIRLGRIGFDNVIGYLAEAAGELVDHPQVAHRASRLTADRLAERLAAVGDLQVIDVRGEAETEEHGMIPGAIALPLADMPDDLAQLDPERPTVVYCQGGYRSSIARTWLAGQGFADVSDLVGGHSAWVSHREHTAEPE
jgi:hydroxyacylglutathione hydrolase